MPSTYYLELKTQELPPNYLTESKEYGILLVRLVVVDKDVGDMDCDGN